MTGLGRSLTCIVALSWLSTLASAQQVGPSASVDLAALTSGEVRVALEPLVFGRTVLGLSFGRWWGGNNVQFVTPASTLSIIQPGIDALAHPAREYMLDLYARVYPKAFSAPGPLHLSGYLGAFLGVDERELDETSSCPVGYACPLASAGSNAAPVICACPLVTSSSGGAIACPCPQRRRSRMITFPDPTGRFEEGQIDPRLTVSVGIRW